MLETMGWISIVPVALAVIDHVKTQLPYALTVAVLCAVAYLIFGIVVA